MREILLLVIFSLLMSGCKDFGPPENHGLTAAVDGTHHQVNNPIVLRIRNNGDSAAGLESCCQALAYYVDRSSSGVWELYQARGMPCNAMCPSILLALKAGASYQAQLTVADAGHYRVRIPYRIAEQLEIGEELLSNSFAVE